MDKEYIEREAVLAEEQEICYWNGSETRYDDFVLSGVIRLIPTADVAPVRHGEWIHKNGEMYCSVCGSEALMDEVYYESPYCPDCGAQMDGGKSITKIYPRCHKCIHETICSKDKDNDHTCPDYRRDAPDGGFYG